MTIGQVAWDSKHGAKRAEVVKKLLDEMFHITNMGAGEGDTRGLAECQSTVISALFMY